jgi:hypothetical protein
MKREQVLIDTLLDEIESMPIGNGGSEPAQYFFFKLWDYPDSVDRS